MAFGRIDVESASPHMNTISPAYLRVLAFTSGMAVMVMEITSARLIAPFFGTSSFIWTNVIGIVLLALSAGYYFGGKLADRTPQLTVLLRFVLLAGAVCLLVPWMIKPLASFITISISSLHQATIIIFVGSLMLTTLVLAFPLMLLGLVSPFIIKLLTLQPSHVGATSGMVFALSTMGSILGTFLPTLLFIPLLGSRATVSVCALVLIAIALWGLLRNKASLFLILLAIAVPLASLQATRIKDGSAVVFEGESAYQYFQIRTGAAGYQYLIFNEGAGVQSIYHAQTVLTGGAYFDYMNVLPYLASPDAPLEIAILGLAGGTMSRSLSHFFPRARIDGVEIDSLVIEAARKWLALDQPPLTVVHQDGRIFLQNTLHRYNLILIDAYAQELYIPWTMTTKEFWQEVEARLAPGGLIAINVNASSEDSELLRAIVNTIASVFPHVTATKIPGDASWNYMVTASRYALAFERLPSLVPYPELAPFAHTIAAATKPFYFDPHEAILTDDKAPIEFMTDKMVAGYLLGTNRE
jgi:spermidine synthase